jgi:integrase
MARKPKSYDDAKVAALPVPRKGKRAAYADSDQRGLYIRVSDKGARSFWVIARDLNGKQIWQRIGDTAIGIDTAREKAAEVIRAIKTGADRGGPQTFARVAEEWFKRYVEAKGLRSATEKRRYLDKHFLPEWGGRTFVSIRRSDVAAMIDKIETDCGPVAADKALAILGALCNWQMTREEDYVSPIIKGMRRSNPKERARDRTLNDDEIRTVWTAAAANGTYGALVRVLLLTGQRREKVVAMRWQDIALDGTWTIPSEAREKSNAGELVLPQIAMDIINAQPRIEGNPYVFPGSGAGHISGGGFANRKAAFDAKVAELGTVAPWVVHDLRRTARSLMARANVRPDIAERVLGHAIPGVGGTYDRHTYAAQKAEALKRLAHLLQNILNPPSAPHLVYLETNVRRK